MALFLNPIYIRARLERCRELASRATNPDLKNIHIAHMEHYQRMLDSSPIPAYRP